MPPLLQVLACAFMNMKNVCLRIYGYMDAFLFPHLISACLEPALSLILSPSSITSLCHVFISVVASSYVVVSALLRTRIPDVFVEEIEGNTQVLIRKPFRS